MRRALKIAAVLIVLVVVAAVAFVAFLPTDRIAKIAADQVKQATGRVLTLSGDISPSFYPVIGVETGPAALSNAEWGEAENMVSASSIKVGVEVMPLLSGAIRVTEVRLIDPVVALEVNEEGVGNWVFPSAGETPPADAGDPQGGVGQDISLGEAVIVNGAVSYSDKTTGQRVEASEINATIGLAALNEPLSVVGDAIWNGEKADLDLYVATPESLIGGAETEIRVSLDAAPVSLGFDGFLAPPAPGALPEIDGAFRAAADDPAAAVAWATGAPAPDALVGVTGFSVEGRAAMDSAAAALELSGGATRDGQLATVVLKADGGGDWMQSMALDLDVAATVGDLASASFKGAVGGPTGAAPITLAGDYVVNASNPAAAAAWATGAAPDGLAGLSGVELAGRVDMDGSGLALTSKGGATRNGQRARFDLDAKGGADWADARAFAVKLDAGLGDIAKIAFNGDVAAPAGASPRAKGDLSIDAPDLKALAGYAGATLPQAGPKAYRSFSLDGAVSTPEGGTIRLDAPSLKFDDITAKGFATYKLDGSFATANFATGPLDLRPYVVGTDSGPSGPGWSKDKIDLSGLGALDANFAIRAASVTLPQVQLGRSDIQGALRRGKLDLKIRELGLYGGGLAGDITLDGPAGNAVRANVTASAVRLLPMLQALAGVSAIEGIGRFEMNVAGRGASLDDIMNSLDGEGAIKLSDGALVGYNLAAMVRNVTSAFTGGDGGPQKTDFSEVSGTFDIAKGVLNNADFQFLGPLIRIAGRGTVDLGGQAMNFRLTPKAVTSLKGQGGSLDDSGLTFPIIVSGPWANLSFRPDLEGGIENLLKDPEAAQQAVEDLVKGVKDGGVESIVDGVKEGGAKAIVDTLTGGGAEGGQGDATKQIIEGLTGGGGEGQEGGGLLKKLFKN